MAIVFELAVYFEQRDESLNTAVEEALRQGPIQAGRYQVPMHKPQVNPTDAGLTQLSVVPVGVSLGSGMDASMPSFALDSAALSELGHGLYRLLARMNGYRMAMVGWDPETTVEADPVYDPEPEREWLEQIDQGYLDGLVFSEEVQRRFSLFSENLAPFAPGFVWVPYRGDKAI